MSKIIIVANASLKSREHINYRCDCKHQLHFGSSGMKQCSCMGNEVNKFDIVVRMNRFKTRGYEEYIGTKTDFWCINRKILLQKTNRYYGFCDNNWDKYKVQYPTLSKCVMMTYCHEKDEADGLRKEPKVIQNNIEVADTYEIICEFRERWREIYLNDNFRKPSTGLTTIFYYLNLYGQIYIHNFDWGKTAHYWGVYGPEDVPSPHHTWEFEVMVVNDLISEGKVIVL